MAFISTQVAMEIEFVSKKPIWNKASWLSVDGVTLVLPNEKEIYFDFANLYGNAEIDENGYCSFAFYKHHFDEEHFFAEESHKLEDLDWEQIKNAEFKEVYIVGDSKEGKYEDLCSNDFTITSLAITAYKEDGEIFEFHLTEEQLSCLNASVEERYAVSV